jgi:hypothetical protein
MKTKRIELLAWESNLDSIEIDWPKVQRIVGLDHVEWLLQQETEQCQLVVDKIGHKFRLMAEFYDDQCLTLYHLMWS